ncbi:MAG: RecF/RecN/SMC domain protein [Anaerocolumna sp.]|jgi:exonuclease SbcC|nr:RecF/RecN/SMC domain protein [Anaerocolumna sp.]
MSKYTVSRIEMNNFKLYKDSTLVDFNKCKFVVLDGPNGFGKTTIFDAIEILLTGKVNRIHNTEYKDSNKPVLYANDVDSPIIIKGEFTNEKGELLALMRKVSDPSVQGKLNDLEDRFQIYRLQNFNDEEGEEVDQKYIEEVFGLVPDKSIYNLMYYIQQEDTLHFLKLGENERLNHINRLFNMEEENKDAELIKKVRDRINAMRKEIGGSNGLGGKIGQLDIELQNFKEESEIGEIKYQRMIPWKEVDWDKLDFEVNESNVDRVIKEILKVEKLINYFTDYDNYSKNKKYKYYLDTKNLHIIEAAILTLNFINNYSEIKSQYQEQINLQKILELLKSKKYIETFSNESLIETLKRHISENEFISLEKDIEELRKTKQNSNELSELVREINETRKVLYSRYSKLIGLNPTISSDICPLCGNDFSLSELKLLEKINEKEKYFSSMLDTNSERILKIETELARRYFNGFERLVTEDKGQWIEKDFVAILDKHYLHKDSILKFQEFCITSGINLQEYINTEYSQLETNLVAKVSNIKELLEKRILPVSSEYLLENIEFDVVYKEYFDEKRENITRVTIDKITAKRAFLNNQYLKGLILTKNKKEKEKHELSTRYALLTKKYEAFDNIYGIYTRNIRKYSNYMISNIEIPFYIYSGKILQDYQGGLGVLIKADNNDEQIRIKFVNSNDSKHDLLNKFSSGQLSGLIISFLLALNTVYSNRKLNCILIDDPLQTMDDINMASFVEVMRNEFSDTQLIVSTHEEEISRYMRYKFLKYGIEPIRLNLKEKNMENRLYS